MLILALETTSAHGGIALYRDDRCIRHEPFPEGLVHGREITVRLQAVLEAHRLTPADLEGLAVSVGPGSYTGSRVGVTAAKTLAFALRIPVVPISSLEALAAACDGEGSNRVLPVIDGRRGFYFAALFAPEPGMPPRRLAPDRVGRREDLRALIEEGAGLCGDGADLLLSELEGDPVRSGLRRLPSGHDTPSAEVVARLGALRLAGARYDREAAHSLEPAYLRPSEPELRRAGRGETSTVQPPAAEDSAG